MQYDIASPAARAKSPKTYFRALTESMNRWARAVGLLVAAVALLLVPSARALPPKITTGSTRITLLPFFTVPSDAGAPLDLVSAGDGSGRLFVATRNGQILISDAAGHLSGTPFRDLASAGVHVYTGGEGGLLVGHLAR